MKRIHLDENVWVIENFISQNEIDIILKALKDKTERSMDDGGWTMRSVARYKKENIWNRWLNANPGIATYEEGHACLILQHEIMNRIEQEFKDYGKYPRHYTFTRYEPPINKIEGDNLTLDWHYEGKALEDLNLNDTSVEEIQSTSFIIFLNDDFIGGDLVFKYKDIRINAKPGMLVNIPIEKEYTHGVEDLLSGERYIMYGHVWKKPDMAPYSEDC